MTHSPVSAPYWHDKPVYLIGGGPSLKGFDFERIRGKGILLGVNRSAFDAPCNVVFSLDSTWIRHNYKTVDKADFDEKILAVSPNYAFHEYPTKTVQYIYKMRNHGLSSIPSQIFGVNSGYAALNLAFLKRAKIIYLLGMDMNVSDPEKPHWHGSYKWQNFANHRYYNKWKNDFDFASIQLDKAGIKVYNCNPNSSIESFDKSISYRDL
jgi:hypothetical protein